MMRSSAAIRYIRDAFCVSIFSMNACCLHVSAQSDIDIGKKLYEKTWAHDGFIDPFISGTGISNDPKEVGNGLGPLFNATSCQECHVDGGAAGVKHNVTLIALDPRSPIFDPDYQVGQARRDLLTLFPGVFDLQGQVSLDSIVHNQSTRPGYDKIRQQLADFVEGGISDSWFQPERRTSHAIAKTPVLAGQYESIYFYLNQRNPPPLHGLGQIDRISNEALDRIIQAQERWSKGKISGRRGVGKFGWRGQTTSLASFVAGACAGEMGLSQTTVSEPFDPADFSYTNPGIDISAAQLNQLTAFVASLPPPITNSNSRSRDAKAGKLQFKKLGCVFCHVEDIEDVTGVYSDFLLHDMGSGLQAPTPAPISNNDEGFEVFTSRSFRGSVDFGNGSSIFGRQSVNSYYGSPANRYPRMFASALFDEDTRAQFPNEEVDLQNDQPIPAAAKSWEALQREWRTPPLWGIADSGPYLHDGRATTIDEAIRWHGGEAMDSKLGYEQMSDGNREKLFAFLNTLVAPK